MLEQIEQEAIYQEAYASYGAGNYQGAALAFSELVLASPFELRFWTGLAAARQMERSFEEALKAWAMASLLEPKNPVPHIHAAECLIQRGEPAEARQALNVAAEIAKDDLLTRIQELYEYC